MKNKNFIKKIRVFWLLFKNFYGKKNLLQSAYQGSAKVLVNLQSRHFQKLDAKERMFFIKRLSFLISSGMTLSESLQLIREQSASNYFCSVLDTLINAVSAGQSLANAIAIHKSDFGDFAVSIIFAGESSGTLGESLEYLALELKKREKLRKKIIGASIYPLIVVGSVFGVVGFLVLYLFPKILPVFASLHMQLPLSTRILIFVSKVFVVHGVYIFSSLIFLCFLFFWSLRRFVYFRAKVQNILMYTPVARGIIRAYNLASIFRTTGLLLTAGLTLEDALSISAKTTTNELYKNELSICIEVINRGDLMSTYLKRNQLLFPSVVFGVVAVGERSGNLSTSLLYLSELFEEDVDDFAQNISSLIEPVLMIVMGVLVGFIAISIISPIYGITANLHAK